MYPSAFKIPSIWQLLSKAWPIGMIIIAWLGHAMVDGVIDLAEIIELMTAVIKELGLDVKIAVPGGVMPALMARATPEAQALLMEAPKAA